ncbi:MAG: polyprenyl synthetase family protein, partial [Chloroflexota bacterium]|nr:polyprenyl synthetase family protein [Chloroflexota bacterium]
MARYQLGQVNADGSPATTDRGKAVRPTLCLLMCEALGGDLEAALPAAAGLELLHNFTLVHD